MSPGRKITWKLALVPDSRQSLTNG
ncbi:hypothetical protein RHECNPAF_750014 [Rhizobium etli CNPAF512]|nr:hypothetical protein RHECNPAF_750014 [Rhizobium etli CNPAF512]